MRKKFERTRRPRNVVAEVVAEQPEQLIIEDQMKLDLTVTTADLAKMVRTDAREHLLTQRAAVCEELAEAQRQHAALAKQLETQSMEAVQGLVNNEDAAALAEALLRFTGEGYVVCTSDVKADVQTMTLTADIDVITAKAAKERQNPSRGYYGGGHEISKRGTVPFTTAMREIVAQLQAATETVREIEARRTKVDRLLADLPSLTDRAESAMLKAYLGKQLRTGDDLLRILDRVQRSMPALPAPKKG